MAIQSLSKFSISLPGLLIRPMSQYASHFVNPVITKEKQAELYETGEIQKLMHVPVKAAKNHETSSIFFDETVRKFTNYVMRGGNRMLARDIVEKSFEKIKRLQTERYHKTKKEEEKMNIELNPTKILHKAVENVKPILMLTPIKRGGVTYQVPIPVTEKHGRFRAMKWLIEAANDKERTIHFPDKMAWELIDAANNTGRVIRKKQELHKQCEANRAYAHYRWG